MEERTHGGDIYGLERPVLDLSISLNPLGVPPCAIQAAREALERSPAYPDPLCRGLRRAISARDGVPEDWVLCGNGASDLIDRLVRALRPDHALVLAPTFSEYHRALYKNNCKVKFHYANMHEDFRFSSALLGKISQEIDAVFLCDPNNPTGTLISPQLLRPFWPAAGRPEHCWWWISAFWSCLQGSRTGWFGSWRAEGCYCCGP